VGISSFAPKFALVGGINAPKKIDCLGTDGRWRPQLVKGEQLTKILTHK
jgi:phosphatidylinositol kinase/protein kinase (PI-3  family)